MEIWEKIKDYDNYEVSDLGRIRSKKYGILTPIKKDNGYLQINLCRNGIYKTFILHRLVALAFIPNPNNYPEINHKDEDKTNNCVDNLEWCTKSYNMTYNNLPKRRCKKVKKYSIDGYFLCGYDSLREASEIENLPESSISRSCNLMKPYKNHIWKYDR